MFLSVIPLCPELVEDLVLTALILHNFLRRGASKHIFCPKGLVDEYDPLTGEQIPGLWEKDASHSLKNFSAPSHGNNSTTYAKKFRETFTEYFGNDGSVPWQWDRC